MTIKAIETVYNGYKFRSRLEARWAVFFDALGVQYEYEPEGLDLEECGLYLPDFYLPHINTYLEIKPCLTDLDDWPEHRMFDYITARWQTEHAVQFRFVLLMGDPWLSPGHVYEDQDREATLYFSDGADAFRYNGFIAGDCNYYWCECPDCGFIGIEFDGRSDRLDCKCCYWCQDVRRKQKFLAEAAFRTGASQEYLNQLAQKINAGCPYHGHHFKDGCPRHGGNLDKGYNAGSPRLMNAYRAARQARFEHGEEPITAAMLEGAAG